MIDAEVRDRIRPADGIWVQDPGVLSAYAQAKANRNILNLPIGERYLRRLDMVRSWAKQYQGVKFWYATNPNTYIDSHTEQEEPEFFNLKWRKRTWDGLYPNRSKLSDMDLNPYWGGQWMTNREAAAMIIQDKDRHPKAGNLVVVEDLKIDLYVHKNEPGEWLLKDEI